MSLMRPLLNRWLRLTEKPRLARVQDPAVLRRGFERKARLYFHGPWRMSRTWGKLGQTSVLNLGTPRTETAPKILYFHGGGHVFGNPNTHAALVGTLVSRISGTAYLPNYRKAPEYPFPCAVEDAVAAWRDLLTRGADPASVVIGGDSAGGGLALALLAIILQEGLPLPAGVFAFSPLTDLTFSGASIRRNALADACMPATRVDDLARNYLGAHDPRDPRASPLFANFAGAPPVYLTAGDTEILLDDTVRLRDVLISQGVDVTTQIEHDLPHVWPIFHNVLPEARATLRKVAKWIRAQTSR